MSNGRFGIRVDGNVAHLIFIAPDNDAAEDFAEAIMTQLENLKCTFIEDFEEEQQVFGKA